MALGAVSESDRHNLRGERISVDTMALVGEENIAAAVRAVADLPRAHILVLAGSLMGGEITRAVRELHEIGIPVVSLNMAGSVSAAADLVVTDPVQAGTMAVMAIADTARFDLRQARATAATADAAGGAARWAGHRLARTASPGSRPPAILGP